jgi:hypothetical protein
MTGTDMIEEEWRTVPGHPDYEVSSLGRVRSWKRPKAPLLMRPFVDRAGYVSLRIDGRRVLVHRAVAAAWHGPCPEDREVDHINNVRGDNRPENLRYLTREENMRRQDRYWLTRCTNGHILADNNLLIVSTTGERKCRTCCRKRVEEFRACQPLSPRNRCSAVSVTLGRTSATPSNSKTAWTPLLGAR